MVLSRDAMRASALATQERLGGPGQWVLNLPPTYVAGVQVLFRSVVAGTEPVLFDGSFEATREQMAGATYVSLVPTQLIRLLRDGWDAHQASWTRSPTSTPCSSAADRSTRPCAARPSGRGSGSCRPTG